MTPHNQLYLKGNPEGILGDCWRTCIASILDLPILDVPHFVEDADDYICATEDWLKERGIHMLRLRGHFDAGSYVMYTGLSPRSEHGRHAVVGYQGEIHHDPHPDRTGLRGLADTTYVFIPKDTDWRKHIAAHGFRNAFRIS